MSVPYTGEEEVRLAAAYVNRVWQRWMEEKPKDKTSKDVLGMVALHFAKLYVREQNKSAQVDELLKKFEADLDTMLDIND